MAETQKRTTKRKTTSAKRNTQKEKNGIKREAWGVIFLLIGVLLFISTISSEGFILNILFSFLSAMIGFGAYLSVPVFLGLSLLFFFNKGKIRLRTISILMLPILTGALVHCILVGNTLKLNITTISSLITTGINMQSGGIFSGTLAMLFMWAFSTWGGTLLLLVLFLVFSMIAFKITPIAILNFFRSLKTFIREDHIEEHRGYEKSVEKIQESIPEKTVEKSKKSIDIPIGNEKSKKTFIEKPFDLSKVKKQIDIEVDDGFENKSEEVDKDEVLEDIVEVGAHEQEDKESNIIEVVEPTADNEDDVPWEDTEIISETDLIIDKAVKKSDTSEEDELIKAMNDALHDNNEEYTYPPLSLLNPYRSTVDDATQELRDSSERLLDTLSSFNIQAEIINIIRGPSVTRFEIQIPRGVKFSKITSLADDLALSLGAASVRIAPIPDKVAVGIEVPNRSVQTVFMREVIASTNFKNAESKLSFSIGKDITGMPIIGDIAKMPHMLIAGTTGSGKSVCINSLLVSILYKATPSEVRLIMIDPKMIELGSYNGVPHLMIPVVTDPKKASGALNWAVSEMMRRYKLFSEFNVRNLESYNNAVIKHNEIPAKEDEEKIMLEKLPQIVIVIDELADLMMVAAREVEEAICRIAQMARAAGMHLVIATQRPSSDVITGIMKANIPSRIAFAVASQIESRIILDGTGAEKLIGKGDMLYSPLGIAKPQRVQGCFLTSEEVEAVVEFIKKDATPEYDQSVLDHIEKQAEMSESSGGSSAGDGDEDEMLPQAIEVVVDIGQASTSMLQRKLKLGYARAARLMDQLEDRGIIGPFEGSKPRQVLITRDEWREMKMRQNY